MTVIESDVELIWGPNLFRKLRNPIDTGVWNGHSYEEVPMVMMMM